MELEKIEFKIRCEMGECKNMATHTIKMSRMGIRSRLHICSKCLKELYEIIGKDLKHGAVETVDNTCVSSTFSPITKYTVKTMLYTEEDFVAECARDVGRQYFDFIAHDGTLVSVCRNTDGNGQYRADAFYIEKYDWVMGRHTFVFRTAKELFEYYGPIYYDIYLQNGSLFKTKSLIKT